MSEAQSSTIRIQDFSPDTIKGMFRYMYTGEVPLVTGIFELLRAAIKYQVDSLVSLLEDRLTAELSIGNAAFILQQADASDSRRLRASAIEFITQDQETFKAVQDTRMFEELMPEVVSEVLSKFLSRPHKRKRAITDEKEFDDSTVWEDLSLSQLRRACAERGLPDDGVRSALLTTLNPSLPMVA